MALRHQLSATLLAAALALGCAALPATASAAPATTTVAAIGQDPLANYANAALDAWASYSRTGSATSLAEYSSIRDAVAAAAAARLGLDGGAMQAAWRSADASHQVAVLAAFTQLGTRYRRNALSPGVAFDCSGLTSWAWTQAGKSLFHQSATQIRSARPVTQATAHAGDLVYYPGHVMMYLGVGVAIIHAPYTGRNIELSFVSKSRAGSVRYGNPIG